MMKLKFHKILSKLVSILFLSQIHLNSFMMAAETPKSSTSSFQDPEKQILNPSPIGRPAPEPGLTGGDLTEPPTPGVGLGQSDLDPLGRAGVGSGMIADPRGFQRPQVQAPNLPDGARFDPFGPVVPEPNPGPNPDIP